MVTPLDDQFLLLDLFSQSTPPPFMGIVPSRDGSELGFLYYTPLYNISQYPQKEDKRLYFLVEFVMIIPWHSMRYGR